MFKNIHLTSLLFFSLILLIGCGGGGSDDDEDEEEELVPTTSELITSRSPDHKDIDVPIPASFTITGDPSVINDDGLYIQIIDVGQNEDCAIYWSSEVTCPKGRSGMAFSPNSSEIQGNTLAFEISALSLEPNTNYLINLKHDRTSSDDDDISIYWAFRTFNEGVLLDSPVLSIGYRTETLEGTTGFAGEYNYLTGETVTFFIGDLVFPSIPAKGTVTPLDLAGTTDINDSTVVNMIRLLQTLDYNQTPEDGISITGNAKLSATQVDFSLSVADFESSTAVIELIGNARQIDPDTGQNIVVNSLVSTAEAISHFQEQLDTLEALKFNASTLPGTYNVVDAVTSGTHVFIFNVDGTVAIAWEDGSSNTASWSVNADGQLIFSGPISDVFTITSGDQSSGDLDIIFEGTEEDGSYEYFQTTGTIELVPGSEFDGTYTMTATATTALGAGSIQCSVLNSSGSLDINNSQITGDFTVLGSTATISGEVLSDGIVSATIVDSNFPTSQTLVEGVVSGTSFSGTWTSEELLCEGTLEGTKN